MMGRGGGSGALNVRLIDVAVFHPTLTLYEVFQTNVWM